MSKTSTFEGKITFSASMVPEQRSLREANPSSLHLWDDPAFSPVSRWSKATMVLTDDPNYDIASGNQSSYVVHQSAEGNGAHTNAVVLHVPPQSENGIGAVKSSMRAGQSCLVLRDSTIKGASRLRVWGGIGDAKENSDVFDKFHAVAWAFTSEANE